MVVGEKSSRRTIAANTTINSNDTVAFQTLPGKNVATACWKTAKDPIIPEDTVRGITSNF
jgi:hypothetical protein